MLFFSRSSFAAASAPVRAARKTGLVELLAIMAMVILFLPGASARPRRPPALRYRAPLPARLRRRPVSEGECRE